MKIEHFFHITMCLISLESDIQNEIKKLCLMPVQVTSLRSVLASSTDKCLSSL